MLGVRGIDHRDASVLIQRIIIRIIVGAVIEVCRPPLRFCSLTLELAYEFQIAVVAAFGIATKTLFRCGLTLQSTFGPDPQGHNWLWAPLPSMGYDPISHVSPRRWYRRLMRWNC